MPTLQQKPTGPAGAALLAAGIGSAVLGLVTTVYEIFPTSAFSKTLAWVKPVGALSGESNLAMIAFLLTWIVLGLLWRGREVKFNTVAVIAFILLLVGLLGTFPPFWHLFIPPILKS